MNFDIAITSILLSSQNSLDTSDSNAVRNDSNIIQLSVTQRLVFSLVLLSLLFLIGVEFVNLLFVNKYSLVSQTEDFAESASSKITTYVREVDAVSSGFDTSAIESDDEITTNTSNDPDTSDYEDSDKEALDTLEFLDLRSFYRNLNNSSQYLRRDSYSQ